MAENNQFVEKKVKRLRLTNPRDVRRYIANLMKRVENSEIEESKARLLNNLAETILKSIRHDEMEQRIVEIESLLNGDQTGIQDDTEEFLKRAK